MLKSVFVKQTLLNVEKSKAPDYMVLVDSTHLLCFQVKTGIQDPTIEDLKIEVAKSPYLDIENNKVIQQLKIRLASWFLIDSISLGGFKKWWGFITFVFVAFNHNMLKHQLIQHSIDNEDSEDNADENSSEESNENGSPKETSQETKLQIDKEYIHILPGGSALFLPENVEVIILCKPGLQALFGIEGYDVLQNPLSDMQALKSEDSIRKLATTN